MSQFAANGATAQHHQTFGQVVAFCEFVPQGVAGQVTTGFNARQRRHHWLCACSNHDATCGQAAGFTAVVFDFNCPGIDNGCIALNHIHAQAGVAFYAVVWLDGFDDVVHTGHNRLEAEAGRGCMQTIFVGMAHLVSQLCTFNEGLGRHTTKVQAIAAHFVGFNQGHFGLHCGSNVRAHQTRCTRTNHHHVAIKFHRLGPLGIHLAGLDFVGHFFCDQREYAQQHE